MSASKQVVGKYYSLANISKVASTHHNLINVLEYMAHSVVRVVQEPPPEHKHMRKLLNLLYDLGAEHHHRNSGNNSVFI